MEMKCQRCGYEWETVSKMIFITCPSCQVKVCREPERIEKVRKEVKKARLILKRENK